MSQTELKPCSHSKITSWVFEDDGKSAGMWSCADCGRKFEPTSAELDRLKAENAQLREGMRGDYDLDAWLEWTKEAKTQKAENAELLDTLKVVYSVLSDAPELNPSNYDHDQACQLNTACCEAHNILHEALRKRCDHE